MGRARLGVTRARFLISGAILGLATVPWSAAHPVAAAPVTPKNAVLFLIGGVSFEEAMSLPALRQLASGGGAGLMTTRTGGGDRGSAAERTVLSGRREDAGPEEPLLIGLLRSRGVQVCEARFSLSPCSPSLRPAVEPSLTIRRVTPPRGLSETLATGWILTQLNLHLRSTLLVQGREPLLVLIAAPLPSMSMDRAGDEVTPIVMARGPGGGLLHSIEPIHALASDTTRQDGLVSNADVAPTVLAYFGLPIPAEMDGEPIRVTEAPAPFSLHRLHLEQRRTRLPIQFGELAFVVVAAMLGTWALVVQGRRGVVRDPARARLRTLAVLASSLFPAVLVAGALPHRTYAWAVSGIVLSMLALTAMALARRRPGDTFAPFVFLGLVGLGLLVAEIAIGGLALRVPLYGGTMFDGARFYGLPNAFLPLLLASGLFVAASMDDPYRGFLVLVAAALVAGFPSLGADIGGSATLFLAAGLWLVLRRRGSEGSPPVKGSTFRTSPAKGGPDRVRIGEVVFIVLVTAVGVGVVLLANRFLPGAPTHAARFVERTTTGPAHVMQVIGDRLSMGFEMIRDVPAAVLPLIGFVLVLVLVIHRVGAVGRGMELDSRWPAIVIVLCVASLFAYVANDTGAAAADPAFIYVMAGITYPAMVASR